MTSASDSRVATGAGARLEPLYQQVAGRLREEILGGRFPVGSTLPTVKQLAHRFGVSQQTAREAIVRLKAAGLVSSRRRGGTRVEAIHVDQSGHVLGAIQQLLSYSDSVRLKVTGKDLVTARTDVAELLQCPPGEPWLRLTGHRRLGDDPSPRVYLEVYIHRAYPRVFEKINGRTKTIFRMFEEIYGEQIVEFRQEIRAVAINGAAARTLGVPEGSLGMRYVNRFIGETGETLEVSVNIHPLNGDDEALRRPPILPGSGTFGATE
jgi:GntR family transcriptional regulator